MTALREALAQGISCFWHAGPPQEDCHREIDFESLRGYAPFDELMRPRGRHSASMDLEYLEDH